MKKEIEIASKIASAFLKADSDYIYDPDHKRHPGGGYHKTEKGWSNVDIDDYNKPQYEMDWDKAKDKNTSSKELDNLAHSKHSFVRMDVASNPNTDAKTLDYLSNEKENLNVVRRVAYNPNTRSDTLDKLSEHKDNYVRKYVASNDNTRIETLVKLAKDSNYDVKLAVASNPNTPDKTVEELINNGGNAQMMYAVAGVSHSENILDKISQYWNPAIKEKVAENPHTSMETLKKLSKNSQSSVRYEVAKNLKTDDVTLLKLTKDNVSKISKTAQKTLDRKMNVPVKDYLEDIHFFANMSEDEKKEYAKEDVLKLDKIKKSLTNFISNIKINGEPDYIAKMKEADYNLGNGSSVRMYLQDTNVFENKKCQSVMKQVADELNSGESNFSDIELTNKFMGVVKSVKSNYATLKFNEKQKTQENLETASYMMGLYSLSPEYNPYITLKTIGYKPEIENNITFDISKLSPEMREKVKDWDEEDIKKFIGWLKKQKEGEI